MKSFVFIILAAIMWGIDGILLTPRYFTNGFYDVKFIVFVSHLFPLLILSIPFYKEYKRIKEFDKTDFIYFTLIALFGGTIGTLSIVKALELSNYSLSLVTLIQKAQPIFAIILAYILLKERPAKKFYIVFIISVISLYFLIFGLENPKLLNENNLKAAIYSLIAALSFGFSTVFSRKVVVKNSFLTTTFYRFFFTTIISGIILLFSNPVDSFKRYVQIPNLYLLTLIIAIYSLIAILMYYKGMSNTKAIYATICELAYPLSSVIVEAIVYNRILSPVRLISAGVLIIAILYLNISNTEDSN